MFCLNVVEHLRLNFRLVVQNHAVHAQAADRLAALALKARIVVLVLLCLATAAMAVTLFRPGREYQIAAAILGGVAVAGHVLWTAVGLEARVYAHRSMAHRLWLICERYRALLAEVQDGLVDETAIQRRRDMLSEDVHAVYQQGFPIDQPAYVQTRQPTPETREQPASDGPVDQLVPATRS